MTIASTDVLQLFPAPPRLLALGEPTHGEDLLLESRNDLFRQLVEGHGYRTIAIESDCLMGLLVDDYVTDGTGSLDEVMRDGFSHGFGESAANRDLVSWMRAYNEGRPRPEQVRFAGFDGPLEITGGASPRQALLALHAYVGAEADRATLERLLGDDDRWTEPAAMMDPSKSVGRTPAAVELRLLADELVARIEAETPQHQDWERAHLYGRTALGLLRYHYAMADPSPSRIERVLAVRASMMAANLLALARRGPVLAYAHNSHLQRDRSSMRMGHGPVFWWSAGAIAGAHLGADYAFLATALGTFHRHDVPEPPPETIEGLLYARPGDRFLVEPAELARANPVPRVSPWFGYAPLDPAQLATIDGVVFVRGALA